MKVTYVVAKSAGKAELAHLDYDPASLKPNEVLMKNEYSVISAGTERAWLIGQSNNDFQSFPYHPGYSAAGHVLAVGSDVKDFKEGDRVIISGAGHRSHTVNDARNVYKIKDDSIDLAEAAFAYIVTFPMLGVRKLRLDMGESVLIAGQGILGLIAVQLASLSGAIPLIVADLDPARRALGLKLGADVALDPAAPDYVEQIKALTDGQGVNAVVEVTGNAIALKQSLRCTAKMGRVSLLGCTRVPDAPIDFYRDVHLPGITLIGAHTSNRPKVDSCHGQWSEFDDYRTFLKYLGAGKLQIRPIISEIVSPAKATEVYDRLVNVKNPPLGIVFDWKQL
ncbi:MAG: zinc-binding alcohol dehydrogenase [Lentisphaeria bacterium]|nr:zinc-binding alcohol dehydrogenase [Lentisphaeria bacterium]